MYMPGPKKNIKLSYNCSTAAFPHKLGVTHNKSGQICSKLESQTICTNLAQKCPCSKLRVLEAAGDIHENPTPQNNCSGVAPTAEFDHSANLFGQKRRPNSALKRPKGGGEQSPAWCPQKLGQVKPGMIRC